MAHGKLLPAGIKRRRVHTTQIKERKTPRKVYWAIFVEGRWVKVPSPWRVNKRF